MTMKHIKKALATIGLTLLAGAIRAQEPGKAAAALNKFGVGSVLHLLLNLALFAVVVLGFIELLSLIKKIRKR
jgi:hypothetical protein